MEYIHIKISEIEKLNATIAAQSNTIIGRNEKIKELAEENNKLAKRLLAFDKAYKDLVLKNHELEQQISSTNNVKIVYKYISLEEGISKIFIPAWQSCRGSKKLIRNGDSYEIETVRRYNVRTFLLKEGQSFGYVYIAYSPFTNCVKIGYTGRDIKHRISELNGISLEKKHNWASRGAGTTMDWQYIYLFECKKDREDTYIHKYIKTAKPDSYLITQGEMFKLDKEEAYRLVAEYFIKTYGDVT